MTEKSQDRVHQEGQEQEILSRATDAKMERVKVPLDKIKLELEHYCHREADELADANPELLSLCESLILEGMQVPIEVFEDQGGFYVVTKGHRRVLAHRMLAGRYEPGFADDTELDAIKVVGATTQDLLVRSVSDNANRSGPKGIARVKQAKKLNDAGVSEARAARALNVSTKTYQRDLLLARHGWMFQHVVDGSIAATVAIVLLGEADGMDRVGELKEDLDAWIASQKQKIREKDRLRKAQDGKGLRDNEKLVKACMPNHLVAHWVELIHQGQRFDEAAEWTFAAGIEADSERLRISSVNLDLAKAPLDRIVKVASKLSLIAKQIAPLLRRRHQQTLQFPGGSSKATAYDLDYLRELGLEDFADELEREQPSPSEPDGEFVSDAELEVHQREEVDLTASIKLPDPVMEPVAADPDVGSSDAAIEPASKTAPAGSDVSDIDKPAASDRSKDKAKPKAKNKE